MEKYDIAIVGGGPAGIMAAIAIPSSFKVVILEKNQTLGQKLLLTGGGRCNITNFKEIKNLLKQYDSKNFLKHSFYTLTNEKLLKYFTDKNLDFIEEENNKIFPESEKSSDILDILTSYLKKTDIKYNYKVSSITDNFIINNEIKAEKVIIACGGVTYPQTGCNIENYKLTTQPVTDIKYGLVPLITKKDVSAISGVSLYNVGISYKKTKTINDVLITHVGLTGPGIIDLSNIISKDIDYDIMKGNIEVNEEIFIDLCPDFTQEELKTKFNKDFKGKTLIKNYLKSFLTKSFIEFFLDECELDGDIQLSQISKKNKNRIIANLKKFKFEIVGFNKSLSKITIGGIDLNYINSKTMESTITPNLYFAGEVLDLDGPTGGYNLKIAFSTGFLAGKSASVKQNI